MQRIKALDPETTTGQSKEFFNAVHQKFGVVPNMVRTMGHSPATLNAYLSFSGALDGGSLGARLNKLIALAVANANQCGYCNAIHSYLAEHLLKLDAETIALARVGRSLNAKAQAALDFALRLARGRGHVDSADVEAVKKAGFSDAEVTEIIGAVALNIFTNYFNTALSVEVDFPKVGFEQAISLI